MVLFKAITEAEPTKGQLLCANMSVTEQILDEANERDGLTVSWMTVKRTGTSMQTAYRVKSDEPTAYKSEWMDIAGGLDFSEALA